MILVVEGLTDAAFFQELLVRLYFPNAIVTYGEQPGRRGIPTGLREARADGTLVEVEFRNQEGKAAIPDVIRGLLTQDVGDLAVAQDIDFGSPEGLVESIRQLEDSFYAAQILEQMAGDRTFIVHDSTVHVIAMGLHQDPTLADLGIAKHEMEDYLVKLMLLDPGLRTNAPELQPLLAELLPVIRAHEGPFESSKELFQLIKPIVQHGFSDTGVVQKLIRDADEAVLRSVLSPLLPDLERAFGV